MKRFTEKYVRTDSQWIKISRDNKERTFTFAHGHAGVFQAWNVQTLPFKWISNWSEAVDYANRQIETFA